MPKHDEVTITRTTYNPAAILGWAGLAVGLAGSAVQLVRPTEVGIAALTVGLIASGVCVTLAGPLRRKTRHTLKLARIQPERDSKS